MEIKNLTFTFADQARPLFQDLNLKIEPEKLTVFLGPSGCGKSTLLRIFAGLLKVNSDFFFYEQKESGFVFQEANLLPWLTSEKNIMLPISLANKKIDVDYFNEVIQLLKIEDCLLKRPSDLSGGQKMRVSIARALISKPQVLFMDEPFSALDEPTRLKLQDELILIQKKLKITILFVTHSFYEAAYLGDRVLIFANKTPTSFVYDQAGQKKFQTRFDSTYQQKVEEIAQVFERKNFA